MAPHVTQPAWLDTGLLSWSKNKYNQISNNNNKKIPDQQTSQSHGVVVDGVATRRLKLLLWNDKQLLFFPGASCRGSCFTADWQNKELWKLIEEKAEVMSCFCFFLRRPSCVSLCCRRRRRCRLIRREWRCDCADGLSASCPISSSDLCEWTDWLQPRVPSWKSYL